MSDFAKARMAVSLQALFASTHIKLLQIGSNLRAQQCPSRQCTQTKTSNADRYRLGVRGQFWRCWACGQGGDVSKAAALLWGCTQAQAASRLLIEAKPLEHALQRQIEQGQAAEAAQPVVHDQAAVESVIAWAFDAGLMDDQARNYLRSRAIPDAVIDEAMAASLLVGLPAAASAAMSAMQRMCDVGLLRSAGMWSTEGTPAAAFRPLWFRYGLGSLEVRSIQHNEAIRGPKMLRFGCASSPFVLPGRSDRFVITKSAIDALSVRALGNDATVLGLPGDSSWHNAAGPEKGPPSWASSLNGRCEIAFAATQPGRKQAQQLCDLLSRSGLESSIMELPQGRDVNSHLVALTS